MAAIVVSELVRHNSDLPSDNVLEARDIFVIIIIIIIVIKYYLFITLTLVENNSI